MEARKLLYGFAIALYSKTILNIEENRFVQLFFLQSFQSIVVIVITQR